MAGVGIRDDGSHVINGGSRGQFGVREASTSFPLFPVMEELGGEQVFDLVRDGVVGVIYRERCDEIDQFDAKRVGNVGPARSGPGSWVLEAVLDDCHPET